MLTQVTATSKMYETPYFYEINFIPIFSEQNLELEPRAYDIIRRRTLVPEALDKITSKSV